MFTKIVKPLLFVSIAFSVWLTVFGACHQASAAGLSHENPALVMTQVPVSTDSAANHVHQTTGIEPDAHYGPIRSFAGSRVVVLSPDGQTRVLSQGFHSACDPDVSFDGTRVLFAGKKDPSSPWRIYEIGVDGAGCRPITPEDQEARSPIYVSSLFTLDSPEPWFTIVYVGLESTLNERRLPFASSLYNVKLDGTEKRRLTYNPNNNFDPFQMWDGRVIYASEQFTKGNHRGRLFAIHIEGADVELYSGQQGKRFHAMPCATEKGLVVFVESDNPAPDGAGQLGCIHESRPHFTYKELTRDPEFVYLYPYPLRDNVLLVSRRPAAGTGTAGVFVFDADSLSIRLLFDSPDYHDLQARPLRPRKSPDGHSTVVDTKATTGVFYGLNCYRSDPAMQPHLTQGTIRRVRFIEGVLRPAGTPRSSSANGVLPVPRRLIGEAPVEEDGSFNVEVPAQTPILVQTLDQYGLALGTSDWIWVQPKETRGCIGCHEDPELTPENEYVKALRRPSNKLVLPPDKRRSIVFREEVAPIVQARCASSECHGNSSNPLFLPLSAGRSAASDLEQAYRALTAPESDGSTKSDTPGQSHGKYIDPGSARTSWIAWQLLGTNTTRPWDLSPQKDTRPQKKISKMPPPGKGSPLSPEELYTILQWIDLGAAFTMPDELPTKK